MWQVIIQKANNSSIPSDEYAHNRNAIFSVNIHLVQMQGSLKNSMKKSNFQHLDDFQEHATLQTVGSQHNCQ